MQAFEIVQRLEAASARNDKEHIITDAVSQGHRQFFIGAKLAYDVLVTFGVQKVPSIDEADLNPDDPGTFTFEDFLSLTGKLSKRELTGHAARDAIADAARSCHGPSWNDFYRRVLLKDLRCGATDSLINKVLTKLIPYHATYREMLIPVFECQLAVDGEDPVHAKKIKGKKLLDIKLDGVRLLTVLDKENNRVTQFTRNGKQNDNFQNIREGLEVVMQALRASVVLDGEVVGQSFQELMTQVNRQSKVNTNNAKLALFDIIPLADFRTGRCAKTQAQRHDELESLQVSGLLRTATGGSSYVVPKIEVDLDTPEGQQSFAEVNRQAIEAGFEGIMIKDPQAAYETRRWAAWMKKKPVISVSLTVVGVERGKPDGKNKNVMGALVCEGEDDGKMIATNVGTGFTDQQRESFMRDADKLIGMIAEVEADALTLERGETVYSMRFPRFKGFRGSVPGEKI